MNDLEARSPSLTITKMITTVLTPHHKCEVRRKQRRKEAKGEENGTNFWGVTSGRGRTSGTALRDETNTDLKPATVLRWRSERGPSGLEMALGAGPGAVSGVPSPPCYLFSRLSPPTVRHLIYPNFPSNLIYHLSQLLRNVALNISPMNE